MIIVYGYHSVFYSSSPYIFYGTLGLFRKKRLRTPENQPKLEDTIPVHTPTLPLRRSEVDKTVTVAPRGKVRARKVQWKPSKKKFRHTLKHHKKVLRASNIIS